MAIVEMEDLQIDLPRGWFLEDLSTRNELKKPKMVKKRPRAYYAAASRRRRKKEYDEKKYLKERTEFIEKDAEFLKDKIASLQQELDLLKGQEISKCLIWREEMINNGLRLQVEEYRFMSQRIKNLYMTVKNDSFSSDLRFSCRNNVSFMFQRFDYLLTWTTKNFPNTFINSRKDEMFTKWMMDVCEVSDKDRYFRGVDLANLRTEMRICNNGGNERWIRLDGFGIPLSRKEYLKVAERVDYFSLIMDTATKIRKHALEMKSGPEASAPVHEFCGSLIKMESLNLACHFKGDDFIAKYKPRYSKPKDPALTASFISAVDLTSLKESSSVMEQCLIPSFGSIIETKHFDRTFFMRAVSVTDGWRENTSNVSLIFGFKKNAHSLPNPNLTAEEMSELLQYEKSLDCIGLTTLFSLEKHDPDFTFIFFDVLLRKMIQDFGNEQ